MVGGHRHGDHNPRTTNTEDEPYTIEFQNSRRLFFRHRHNRTCRRNTGDSHRRDTPRDPARSTLYKCRPRLARQKVAQFDRNERPEITAGNRRFKGQYSRLRHHFYRLSHLVESRATNNQHFSRKFRFARQDAHSVRHFRRKQPIPQCHDIENSLSLLALERRTIAQPCFRRKYSKMDRPIKDHLKH